jgi:type IV secretion system protein VirB10
MSEQQKRKKLSRNLVGWMFLAVIGLILVVAVLTNGTDLGQGEINKKMAEAKAQADAAAFSTKVANPQERTKAALEEAARSAGAPSGPASAPPQPLPNVNLEATKAELAALEQLKHAAEKGGVASASTLGGTASRSPRSGASADASKPEKSASFVMFDAGASSLAQGAVQQPKSGGDGLQPLPTVKLDSVDPDKDPRVQAARKELEDARAAAAAAQKKEPEFQGTSQEKWLFDQQSAAPKTLPPNLVATRNKALYWLSSGTVIQAVLQTAVDTSLPGTIVARTTQPVYDSRYGQYLVIPSGSRLIGKYSSSIQDGQSRVMMVFDRLVTPAGGEVALGNMSASDALGRAGVEGTLETNFWSRMGISLLMAVESIAVDRLSPQQTTTAQNGQTTTGRANSTAGQILLNTANQELQRRYAVPPKVTMEPGRLVSIITTGSIEIPPVANTR